MGEVFCVNGGRELYGRVDLHGAKNAVLPMLAAGLLTEEEVIIEDVPFISDIDNMLELIKEVGGKVCREGRTVRVRGQAQKYEIPLKLQKVMRSSMFMLGALLSTVGEVKMSSPGGCDIGARPLDIHLDGLRRMGAVCEEKDGEIFCHALKLKGAKILLRYPSVGATENLILAAVKAEGKTTLVNCAREPEIVSLARLLNGMGARIKGEGTSVIEINGVDVLCGATQKPVADRIVAGTLLAALKVCGGEISIGGAKKEHMLATLHALSGNGFEIFDDAVSFRARARKPDAGFETSGIRDFTTGPYPLLPTDMQPMIAATRCFEGGVSRVRETVFENRFSHILEMAKLGAHVSISGDVAYISHGRLHAGDVCARDLRGGAGLVVFTLGISGESRVSGVEYIKRGYENLDLSLNSLGAEIRLETQS